MIPLTTPFGNCSVENNRSLLWESYRTHNYAPWAKWRLPSVRAAGTYTNQRVLNFCGCFKVNAGENIWTYERKGIENYAPIFIRVNRSKRVRWTGPVGCEG